MAIGMGGCSAVGQHRNIHVNVHRFLGVGKVFFYTFFLESLLLDVKRGQEEGKIERQAFCNKYTRSFV